MKTPMSSRFNRMGLPVTYDTGDGMKEHLKYIGANIRAARRSKNLTIDTLSELIGISPSFLGTLERGESSLSVETLIGVCKVLGVSADSIIIDRNVTAAPDATDKLSTITTLLNNAADEELDFLIGYIKLYRGRVRFKDA